MAEKANIEMPIDKKKWYKNIMAIIGMISALAGAVYGVMQILESSLFKPKKVFTNIEIVLDRSASMNESFDGSTKWQVAVSAVKENLETKIAKSDNLAFRKFGGDCLDDNNTQLVVEFDQNNEAEVRNTLRKINLAGKTTLVSAIVEATGDFNDPERFVGEDVYNSIIVITGGGDFCHPNPAQIIQDRLRGRIEVSFRLIGMGLTDEQKSDFKKIASKTGGKVLFADNQKELKQVLKSSLVEAHALYSDDFSDPLTIAANWEIHDAINPKEGPSHWIIKDGQLFQTSNIFRSGSREHDYHEGSHIVTKQGIGWTDYEISVDFRIAGDNDGVGIVFRYHDAEHYYRFITLEDSLNRGPFRRLQVKDGDKFITLAESKEGYDPSKPHNIRVRIVGDHIVVFFDDQQILSAKDAHYKSGRVGLQVYAEQPYFDNFIVSSILGTKRKIESEELADTTPPLQGVFRNDSGVLAKFEFNGNVMDSSGKGKDAHFIGGKYVKTSYGKGLHVYVSNQSGIDWSEYANLLLHPYTIEIVLTPRGTKPWGKLFGFDDSNDNGWYYKDEGIQDYPNPVLGIGEVEPNEQHYIAFVSTSPSSVDVYFQGKRLGSTKASFKAPPNQAIFFCDDSSTGRSEQVNAVVEEMRISRVARTANEIAAVQKRLKKR